MTSKLDLKQLSIDRSDPSPAGRPPGQRRRWFSRFALPLSVLVGFMVLIAASAGHRLLPVRNVTVVPVVVKRSATRQSGQPLFKAPGWVEPRPTPISVPALAAGVVQALHVVEGQQVSAGDVIANLVTVDSELAVKRAEAALAIRRGEYNRAIAERDAARLRLDKPVHLDVSLADAESELSAAQAELDRLPHLIRSAKAKLNFTRESVVGKRAAGDGISGVVKQRAEADLEDAEANFQELQARQPNMRARTLALQRKVQALKEQRSLLIEEKRQLHEAEAKIEMAAALRDEARVQLETAELARSRMAIKSPLDGRILKVIAAPGDRVMGMDTTAEHRSSTVVQMYDPSRLQVRADVRIEDVPLVVPGQPVRVETAASPTSIDGYVLQSTSSANIQKNTLEVKVALVDPPTTVTPEMLATVTFMAPQTGAETESPATRQRLQVPRQLVQNDQTGTFVWIVDADGRAERVSLDLGSETADGMVEVNSGLNVTDKLITNGTEELTEGDRVVVRGDDPQLGL